MTLHGPANADAFRTKVGRYYDRFYHDPLPADTKWDATDDVWPAVSTIKRADGRDWSTVSLGRAAEYVAKKASELDGMSVDEIAARFAEVNKAGLNRAAKRGTAIHQVAEDLARGVEPIGVLDAAALPYLPALRQFLDDLQPEFLLVEGVVINRTVGYGGTFDSVLRINSKVYMVDWKTRTREHGAYPEEGSQLAAYANAEYVIVEEDD